MAEQDISHLIPNVNDDIQKQQIIDAKPSIQKVLSLVACTTDSKGTAKLNKYATDNYVFTYKYPTYLMKNHIPNLKESLMLKITVNLLL